MAAQAHRPELWAGDAAACEAAHLQKLHRRVTQSTSVLDEEQHWLREVLFAGWTGGELKEAWFDMLRAVEALANFGLRRGRPTYHGAWAGAAAGPTGRSTRGDPRRSRDVPRGRRFSRTEDQADPSRRGISSSQPVA